MAVVKRRTRSLNTVNSIGEVTNTSVIYRKRKGTAVGYTISRSKRKVCRFKRRRYRGKLLKRSKFKKRRKFLRNRRHYKKQTVRS